MEADYPGAPAGLMHNAHSLPRSAGSSPMTKIRILTALVCFGLGAAPAQAQSLNLIGASPVSRFNEADLQLMMAAVDRALADPANGVPQAWKNDATGASGVVTARRDFDAEGRKCRELLVANSFRTLRGEAEHSFCRDGTGRWKLVQ